MEGPAGQVDLKGSLPCSENNVLQPMLHPVYVVYGGAYPIYGRKSDEKNTKIPNFCILCLSAAVCYSSSISTG